MDLLAVGHGLAIFPANWRPGGLAVGIVQILLIIPLSIQNLLYHSLLGKEKEEQKQILLQNSRLTFTIMLVAATAVFF